MQARAWEKKEGRARAIVDMYELALEGNVEQHYTYAGDHRLDVSAATTIQDNQTVDHQSDDVSNIS